MDHDPKSRNFQSLEFFPQFQDFPEFPRPSSLYIVTMVVTEQSCRYIIREKYNLLIVTSLLSNAQHFTDYFSLERRQPEENGSIQK